MVPVPVPGEGCDGDFCELVAEFTVLLGDPGFVCRPAHERTDDNESFFCGWRRASGRCLGSFVSFSFDIASPVQDFSEREVPTEEKERANDIRLDKYRNVCVPPVVMPLKSTGQINSSQLEVLAICWYLVFGVRARLGDNRTTFVIPGGPITTAGQHARSML